MTEGSEGIIIYIMRLRQFFIRRYLKSILRVKYMKLISIAVPSYNSQDYLNRCVDTLLAGGDDVEILIVNDGSTDNTGKIADEYQSKYPGIVRAIHKENGGHGSGINASLKVATGLYFKVVDSDDWLDSGELLKLIADIKKRLAEDTLPDLYVTNFIYDHVEDHTFHVSAYTKKMPVNQIFGWNKVKAFHYSHMLLMHALCFKRQVLIDSKLCLPEHTFYVDNVFAYQPLPYVKTICYLNLNLYHYFIGRADQSVNMKNFVARYSQQIRVMNTMMHAYKWEEIKRLPKGLKRYMWHALQAILVITLLFTCAEYSAQRKAEITKMWKDLKVNDRALYRRLRYRSYSTSVIFLPWRLRGFIMTKGYLIMCKKNKLG